jgi:hypothetical protein
VHLPGGDHYGLACLGDDLLHPVAELHAPLEDLELLLLLRVHVRAGF